MTIEMAMTDAGQHNAFDVPSNHNEIDRKGFSGRCPLRVCVLKKALIQSKFIDEIMESWGVLHPHTPTRATPLLLAIRFLNEFSFPQKLPSLSYECLGLWLTIQE